MARKSLLKWTRQRAAASRGGSRSLSYSWVSQPILGDNNEYAQFKITRLLNGWSLKLDYKDAYQRVGDFDTVTEAKRAAQTLVTPV